MDSKPAIPGTDVIPELSAMPTADIKDPGEYFCDPECFPEAPSEKPKIIPYPNTIFHGAKKTLGKPPKPLKPKPFMKVINTIPMPMRMINVPYKPAADTRG